MAVSYTHLLPAVGLGDAADEEEAQPMGALRRVGGVQYRGELLRVRANPVVTDGKEAGIRPIPAHGNPDGASLRVVQDAVLQQIGQRAQKQPLVPLQADGFVHLLSLIHI